MDDYISRADAVKTLKTIRQLAEKFFDACDDCADTMNDLAKAADVRPVVRGEWWPAKDGYYGHVMCSACHKIESHKTDFCPNCGADMREETK